MNFITDTDDYIHDINFVNFSSAWVFFIGQGIPKWSSLSKPRGLTLCCLDNAPTAASGVSPKSQGSMGQYPLLLYIQFAVGSDETVDDFLVLLLHDLFGDVQFVLFHGHVHLLTGRQLLIPCLKTNKTRLDCLVQDCSISIALAMEILQSCTKPAKCSLQ